MSDHSEFTKYSRETILDALSRLDYKAPAIFKWFFFWELEPAILMNDLEKKWYHYPEKEIYAALIRFKEQYPSSYKAFFLYELEKPFNPFERQPIMFLSEEDTKKLGL